MKIYFLLVLLCGLFFSCAKTIDADYQQQQTAEAAKKKSIPLFNKLYGGDNEDYINTVIRGSTGGYVFAGESYSMGPIPGSDAWIVQVDETGKQVWQKTFGGSDFERGSSIVAVQGGYLVAGKTLSSDFLGKGTAGWGDGFLIKIDQNGNLLNHQVFGGTDDDEIKRIISSGDGNYILVGSTYSTTGEFSRNHGVSDVWVMKIDPNLHVLWQKILGGSLSDAGADAVLCKDGDYMITGFTSSNDGDVHSNHGESDFWVVKLSANGAIRWEKTYGGSGFDLASTIASSADGGALVSGLTTSSDGNISARKGGFVDGWMIKIDKHGKVNWDKSVGGTGFEQCLFSLATDNGDFLVGGSASGTDGDFAANKGQVDGWILRLDKQGKEKWVKVAGGATWDYFRSVAAGPGGTYVIGGTSDSNNGDVSGNHGFTDGWLLSIADK